MESPDDRPVKRARLACEPCRRKKAKCSGEQPVCALCHRLQQACLYREHTAQPVRGRQADEPGHDIPSTDDDRLSNRDMPENLGLQNRVAAMETTLRELVQIIKTPGQGDHTSTESVSLGFGQGSDHQTPTHTSDVSTKSNAKATLPFSETVLLRASKTYLDHIECQPLPLFNEDHFVASFPDRDPAVIHCVLAAATRVSEDPFLPSRGTTSIVDNVENAYRLVMHRITDGGVGLSTLQSLCLLILLYFDAGQVDRSRMLCSILSSLAHSAQLHRDNQPSTAISVREERRRCYWATVLLCRLLDEPHKLTATETPWAVPLPHSLCAPPLMVRRTHSEAAEPEVGAIKFVFQMSEMLWLTMSYVKACRRPSSRISYPWSPGSQYNHVHCAIMDQAHEVPLSQRYRSIKISSLDREILEQSRHFWYAWILGRMVYHAVFCVLNHPVLLTLQVGDVQKVSDAFLNKTSHAITNHTTWIMHYIEFMKSRKFYLSDIYVSFCAGVVATIELQRSLSQDKNVHLQSKSNFESCLSFIVMAGKSCSYAKRLANRLQTLAADMSAWADRGVDYVDDGITIDVAGIFEVLYLPSALTNPTAGENIHKPILGLDLQRDMFGSHSRDQTFNPNPTRLPRISPIDHEPLQSPSLVSPIGPNETGCAVYGTTVPSNLTGGPGSGSIAGDLVLPFNDFFLNPFQHNHQNSRLNDGDLLLYERGVDNMEDLQAIY